MIKTKLTEYGKPEISRWILLIGLIMPLLKYNFKFPEYIDLFYILYFIYIILTKPDTREPIAGGLILLVTLPLLLIAKKEKFAEIVANGAYYLLVVGVTAQLINLSMENGKNKRSSF